MSISPGLADLGTCIVDVDVDIDVEVDVDEEIVVEK